jgi:hypothetical protein
MGRISKGNKVRNAERNFLQETNFEEDFYYDEEGRKRDKVSKELIHDDPLEMVASSSGE